MDNDSDFTKWDSTSGRPRPIERSFSRAQDMLTRIREGLAEQADLLRFLMGLNDDITTDVTALATAVDNIAQAYTKLLALNADLEKQLAEDAGGLTANQGAAIAARINGLTTEIAAALAPVGAVPPAAPPAAT